MTANGRKDSASRRHRSPPWGRATCSSPFAVPATPAVSSAGRRLGRPCRVGTTPVVPGHEVSGVVALVGFGVVRWQVGDEVYGLTDWYGDGTLAELVSVEARNLARKPVTLDYAAT